MLGWYINILGLVVLVFAIRSSRLCWLASAMIKRRWSSNITSSKLSLRFASCHCQSCSCKLFSKDVSCRWKTSKYEYTQCQQILEYPCSSDWIFTAVLKSLWNILNWGIVTMRRSLFHILQRESNRSVQGPLGIDDWLVASFSCIGCLARFYVRRKKCGFAMQAITSGWHLGLENLGGWSWMRKILFETLSELPRAPLLLHICHVGICHILNLAFNYAKFRNTSRRRWTFLKNFVTVNKENLVPSRFNLIDVKFLEGRYL